MRFLRLVVSSFGLSVVFGVFGACGGTAFTGQSDTQAGAGGASAAAGKSDKAGAESGGDAGEGVGGAGASSGGSASAGESMGGAGKGGAASAGASMVGASMGGASAGSGGAIDQPDSTCPKSTPKFGHACVTGLACSYGDDPRPACRAHYTCANGKWPAPPPAAACPALTDCSMTPSGFPNVGKACNTVGEECTFDGGTSGTIYCRCSFCGESMSCPAGMADWACAGPPAAPCPEDLPNEGQACEKKQTCFYGVPCEGASMKCDGKTWSQEGGGCAN